ncbi:MAG TPA: sigma-70 family RNA polymerase sigma factor [Chloroflexia bacterium]|nr:sigma-70 family RNA polymerase sigma factor [Chloroflexia bacterium]
MQTNDPQNTHEQDSATRSVDERSLVEAAIRGDVDAFGELYQYNAAAVYRYIAYRVQPPSEAEDLTAQVFMNAWKAVGRYQQSNTPFLAWLYTIAHNQVINYSKSKSQKTIFTSIDEAYDIADGNRFNNPDYQSDKMAEYEELRKAVLKLPYDQQQVIYLRYVEELGHAEIGRLMDKSEVTVRGILFRAHDALRKSLKREIIFGEAN